MFKKLRNLFTTPEKIDTLAVQMSNIQDQLNQLNSAKRPTRYQEIPITTEILDYESLKDEFGIKYNKDANNKYRGIRDNFQECVIQYDKLLYYAKTSINYVELTSRISELNALRRNILNIIFNSPDVLSFYLYVVDTNYLKYTISGLPFIDTDKIFMIPNKRDIDVENYIMIDMQYDKVNIITPMGTYELENKLRKTIIRVLYSLYTEKYYLYHLFANTNKMEG